MQITNRSIELRVNLELSEAEVEMFAYLCSQKPNAALLETKYTEGQWAKLWSTMRQECETAIGVFKDTKRVFTGMATAQRKDPNHG